MSTDLEIAYIADTSRYCTSFGVCIAQIQSFEVAVQIWLSHRVALKIDQDTAKTVKRKILKNNSFCMKVVFFLTKTEVFQDFTFYCFCCILVNI